MKKFLLGFVLLLSTCPLFGQATNGFHRTAVALARAFQGVTAQVVPNAKVTVTSTATGLAATIYSDPALSSQITPSVVTADNSGNYGYYIPLSYCVTETITSPGQGTQVITNICNNSVLGSGLPTTGGTMTGPIGFNSTAQSGTVDNLINGYPIAPISISDRIQCDLYPGSDLGAKITACEAASSAGDILLIDTTATGSIKTPVVFSSTKPQQKIFWYGSNDIVLGDSATITVGGSQDEVDWGYLHLQVGNAGGVIIGSAGSPVYRYVIRNFYLLPVVGKTPAFAFNLINAQEGRWIKGHIESFSTTNTAAIYDDPSGMSITEEFENVEFTGNYYNVWFPRGSQDVNAWNFKDCLLNSPASGGASVMIDIGYGSYSVNGISFTDKTHFELAGTNSVGVRIASGVVSGVSFKDTYVELLGTGEHVVEAQELASGTPNLLLLKGLIWNGGSIYSAGSTPFLFDSSVAGGEQDISLTLGTVIENSATGQYVVSAVGAGTTVTTNITGPAIWGFDFTSTSAATTASSGAHFTDTATFQGVQTTRDNDGLKNQVQPLGSATAGNYVQYIDLDGVQHLAAPAIPNLGTTIYFLYGLATPDWRCSATGWYAAPTYNSGTGVVTFPNGVSSNAGSITCTDFYGIVTTQSYPTTGGGAAPQTVNRATQFANVGGNYVQLNASGVLIGTGGVSIPSGSSTNCFHTDGSNGACSVGVADIQITVGTTLVGANACSSYATATMTGLATTNAVNISPSADYSAVTGWSAAGSTLYFNTYSTANTLHWQVCNNSGASITPSGSTVWNVSAQ